MDTEAERRLRNRLLPGAALLDEPRRWAPSLPRDIAEPPPPIEEGTAQCSQCSQRLPLADLDIVAHGYRCKACSAAPAIVLDDNNLKVGRGRWWILPLAIAVGGTITIIEPALVLVSVFIVAAAGLVLVMRRGL